MIAINISLTLIGMHLIGTVILFGYVSGPSTLLATPILCLFGLFFVLPEAIGLALIWKFYEPYQGQSWLRIVKFALVFTFIGAIVAAPFIPKEDNNELKFWIGGLFAGAGAAVFAFACIHKIKMAIINGAEQTH